ncbi:MAG TPA: DUF2911 domain-containing protein [Cyclobacteriaceae bacterium]|nr:DUF2911 domain-containing protein [Cyclobacteriaceae bacterium]
MKKFNLLLVAFFALVAIVDLNAQKLPPLDASPADIAWLPSNRKDAVCKVIYGRPSKKGRTMLGGTEAYGKVWRLGANESTEIVVLKKATFGDKVTLEPGTYSVYAIPNADKWTIIFNKKLNTWGAYEYDEKQDVGRFDVPVGKPDAEVEAFTIAFEAPNGNTSNMMLAWENTLVKVPVKW